MACEPSLISETALWGAAGFSHPWKMLPFSNRFGLTKKLAPLSGPMTLIWTPTYYTVRQRGSRSKSAKQYKRIFLETLLARGRQLGVVREDLPEELLLSLVVAVDDAHDRWLYARLPEMGPAELEKAAARMSELLRRLLSP